jgi:hypothetical protein
VWILLVLTVVVAIPACVTSAFILLDADTCAGVTAATWACHSPIRYFVAAVLVVVVSTGTLKWCAFLARVQNYREANWASDGAAAHLTIGSSDRGSRLR